MSVDYNLALLMVSNLVTIIVAVWKLSQWEERLQYQITQNKRDLTDGMNSLRNEMRQRDYLMAIKLNTLIAFIEKTTDYQNPAMDNFEDD